MKLQTTLAITALCWSCFHATKTNNKILLLFLPKVTEAYQYVVPKDSMAEPKAVRAPKTLQDRRRWKT
jgi:hypothetical protein